MCHLTPAQFSQSLLYHTDKQKPIKITTDTNEFQIGMSRQNNNSNKKNDFEKKLRDLKRKIKAKNEER